MTDKPLCAAVLAGLVIYCVEKGAGWFAFAFRHPQRNKLAQHLEANGIGCRMPFGGNLTRQPAFQKCKDRWRVHGTLDNANQVMDEWLFVGVYPGLKEKDLQRIAETIISFGN